MPKINDIATALAVLDRFTEYETIEDVRITLRNKLMAYYSTPIESAPFRKRHIESLKNLGVRFVGEVFYHATHIHGLVPVPRDADPLAEGWIPPYWNDPDFLSTIQMSCLAYFGKWGHWGEGRSYEYHGSDLPEEKRIQYTHRNCTFARQLHGAGLHYAVQYLVYARKCWEMNNLQERLNVSSSSKLWAAALIPPSWKPDPDVPEDWAAEEQKIETEVALYETPQAWVVQWQARDGCYYADCGKSLVRIVTSYVEDPAHMGCSFPFQNGEVKFQWSDWNYYWGYMKSNLMVPLNGKTVRGYGACWSPYDPEFKSFHLGHSSFFWCAKAFDSESAAKVFRDEILAKPGMPIDDE